MKIALAAFAPALIVPILVTGCQSAGERSHAQEQMQALVVKVDQDGVQRAGVIAGSYFFKPSHLIVKVNVPVELVARREPGVAPHDLVIRAPDAGINVEQDLATEPKRIAF